MNNKLIQIEDKLYNMDEFREIHPGGKHMLEAYQGTDATLAFNTYHKFRFPHKKMETYLVGKNVNNFSEENNDILYDELKKIVYSKIKYRYADFITWIKIFGLLTATFYIETIYHYYNYPILYVPFLGLLYALIGLNIQHDANHGALSKYPFVNKIFGLSQDFIGGSSIDWTVHHIVYHHPYTNQLYLDPDIDPGILIRLHESKKSIFINNTQHIHTWILLSFFGFVEVFKSFKNIIYFEYCSSKYPFPQYYKEYRLIGIIFKLFFMYRWLYLPPSIIHFILLSCITGLYLSIFFIISHNFDEVETYSKLEPQNFLIQQVNSSSSIKSPFLTFINGGLNYQIEHHLFPGICHCHYNKLSIIVEKFLKEKGIQANYFDSFLDNLKSTYKRLYLLRY
jgi:fatty acid desaturase (delta-4 desaturase)